MTKDFAEFLDALNKKGASYVVIGGMAVLSYIPYRTTRDIDIVIEPTADNARKTREALAEWGDFEPEFSIEDFLSGDVLSFGGLLRVEIHTRIPGTTWSLLWQHRVRGELRGVPTYFAGLDQLIAMKRAAGRPEKDLPDLKRLEKLKEQTEPRKS
jgi:hypothetical protein